MESYPSRKNTDETRLGLGWTRRTSEQLSLMAWHLHAHVLLRTNKVPNNPLSLSVEACNVIQQLQTRLTARLPRSSQNKGLIAAAFEAAGIGEVCKAMLVRSPEVARVALYLSGRRRKSSCPLARRTGDCDE